jgi:hypothetical protein
VRLAVGGDGRVEDRDVVLEDLRTRRGADAFGRDDVLERDRDAVAARVIGEREVRIELAVPLVDRRAVGREELRPRHFAAVEQVLRAFSGEPERVDHAGGLRK